MTVFEYLFEEPFELEALIFHSDKITELGKYSFRGNKKGMDYFFQICNLIAYEMSYLSSIEPNHETNQIDIFKSFSSFLRSSFYWQIEYGKGGTLEEIVRQEVDNLKQYKFMTSKPKNPFMREYSPNGTDYEEVEITVDRVFRMMQKVRQHRISFYELLLQEYIGRKERYNKRLGAYLENKEKVMESRNFSLDSILSELGLEPITHSKERWDEVFYEINNVSYYLRDLLKLDNPETERYDKDFDDLPRYRICGLHAHPEGFRAFFELFLLFKEEMSFILTENLDESFFERTLTVLIRDFIDDFEKDGDLENVIIEFIDNLEKYEFLSLQKEVFFDKISKMIYSLRTRHIEFYEAVLNDYLANKEKYDNAM